MLTISIPVYCKKKKKTTRSLYLTCMTKPTHLYTIFTEMMTHYHFHQQNRPSSYHHRNKGSLIYLEQFQNHPIGIPKLMKMHLKTSEHPRTSCFREYPPWPYTHGHYAVQLRIQVVNFGEANNQDKPTR